ncbi:MAG: T9SS type A sorting domain-containing protein, partial [Bacteroidota bacterium]
PFNPATTIEYQLPKETRISLKVFNMLGQEVATLAEGEQSAGYYSVQWNASSVSSGVYIYRLQSKEFVRTNKMILMK